MGEGVRAAGGLVWTPGGRTRLALVHRARYGDWTLPKGKLDAGEDWLEAAVREVEEETGWRAVPRGYAGTVRYDAGGTPKEVRFWHMDAAAPGRPARDGEVDEVRFVEVGEALGLLTYETEREFLRSVTGR